MKKFVFIAAIFGFLSSTSVVAENYSKQELEDFIQTEVAHTIKYVVERVGWNHFLHVPNVTQHEDKFVVRPNSDTLYSMGMLNVEDGYVVIQLPKSDRYMSMMVYEYDHYLADDGVINDEQRPIVIVKKGNPVPNIKKARIIMVEQGLASVLIRTLLLGQKDLPKANELQQSVTMEKVGIDNGKEPLTPALTPEKLNEMRQFFRNRTGEISWDKMYVTRSQPIEIINRAQGVYEGAGALPSSEAKYESVFKDTTGNALNSSVKYTLSVPADIPVKHFWSITVYDDDGLLIPNTGRVYSANSKISTPNADGSFTVNFGGCEDGRLNCIPVGDGSWNMTWRYYGPEGAIADNSWKHIQPMPVK
jgi:hypothetical protein